MSIVSQLTSMERQWHVGGYHEQQGQASWWGRPHDGQSDGPAVRGHIFFSITSFFTRYRMNRVKYLSDTVENSGQFYIVSAWNDFKDADTSNSKYQTLFFIELHHVVEKKNSSKYEHWTAARQSAHLGTGGTTHLQSISWFWCHKYTHQRKQNQRRSLNIVWIIWWNQSSYVAYLWRRSYLKYFWY